MRETSFRVIFWVICYLIIEFSLRIFNYLHPVPILFGEDLHKYRGQPHAVVFGHPLNAQGFKDTEFDKNKSSRWRIAGLGDSFAFGVVPYPDNYLTIAETLLNESHGAEIYNMGIPSTGPPEQLNLLISEAFEWQPDMVLLNFFVGNDFQNSLRSAKKTFFQKYSYTATLLFSAYRILRASDKSLTKQLTSGMQAFCDSCPSMDQENYVKLQADRSFIFNQNDPLFEQTLADAVFYIDKMKELCDARNIPLVVSLLPDETQINPTLRKNVDNELEKRGTTCNWDIRQPNRRLTEELMQRKIPVIDLLPGLLEAEDTALYVPRDTHWNRKGNLLAGQILARQLSALLEKTSE